MPIENSISFSITDAEAAILKDAYSKIKNVFNNKGKSLTPAERGKFSRVKYEKQIWIDKVKMHIDQQPDKVPAYINKEEFIKDYTVHAILTELLILAKTEFELMQDTHLLLGYDLDVNALRYYRSIKTAAKNNDPGAQTIFDDLKQQFEGRGRKKGDNNK